MNFTQHNTIGSLTELNQAEELTVLKTCFQYGSILFTYPIPVNYDTLKQTVTLFADQHLALTGNTAPGLPDLADLQYIYTTLFSANPAGLPAVPYASYYLDQDGQIGGETFVNLQKMLAAYGAAPVDENGEPADHLSCIFGFAALLAERSVTAPDNAAQLTDLLSNYLDPWYDVFCSAVSKADSSGFYSSSAEFCSKLLARRHSLFPLTFNKLNQPKQEEQNAA